MKLVDVPGGTGCVRNPKRHSPAVVPSQERETIPLQRSARVHAVRLSDVEDT